MLGSGRFLRRLRKGSDGVKLGLPKDWKKLQRARSYAILRDESHQVVWFAGHSPFSLDLSPENDDELERDIERAARHVFDEDYAEFERKVEVQAEQQPTLAVLLADKPRTVDPEWSPVVEFERLEVGSYPALKLVYRKSYRPGAECMVGCLLVPANRGTFAFIAGSDAEMTGIRESLLWAKWNSDGLVNRDEDGLAETLISQAQIDDPKHDTLVPGHCLTCVRSALAWLLNPSGAQLAVVAPGGPSSAGPAALERQGAAVDLPNRYKACDLSGMPEGVTTFTRFSIPDVDLRVLDVCRPTQELIGGSDRLQSLERLVHDDAERSSSTGVGEVTAEITGVNQRGGRIDLSSYLVMEGPLEPGHATVRWIADEDGEVFRIVIAGPQWFPREELLEDLEVVAGSFRRTH